MKTDTTLALLQASLECAVPLWQMKLRQWPFSSIVARAQTLSQIVAEKGDVIMFRSKKKGESAAAFNALAEGVACLSFCPGGVKLFGCHFEARHPESTPEQAGVLAATIASIRIEE